MFQEIKEKLETMGKEYEHKNDKKIWRRDKYNLHKYNEKIGFKMQCVH